MNCNDDMKPLNFVEDEAKGESKHIFINLNVRIEFEPWNDDQFRRWNSGLIHNLVTVYLIFASQKYVWTLTINLAAGIQEVMQFNV